jgi:hypothetical protein
MAAPVPIPFWTQHYEARSRTTTAERLVNWYLEPNPQNAKFPFTLYPTPGLTLLTTVGDGPIRGVLRMEDDLYVVSGSRLYRIESDLTEHDIGEVKGAGNVYMATNETHVLIVTPQISYAANASGIVQTPEQNMVGAAYQDGYGISGKRGTEQFYISDLDDLTGWTATEFSSADALADELVNLVSLHRHLMILGKETIEWWANAGVADFPFVRVPGGFAEIGCRAPGSVAKIQNTVFWLGNDNQVYVAVGFQPQPISPPGISRLIEQRPSPQTALAFVYSQEGHTFYVLNFSDMTLVYDLSSKLWHRRESMDQNRWRANCYARVWDKDVVGDYQNGKIYELDLDVFTEDGETIRREADSAPVHVRGELAIMHELFVDMETGVGLDGDAQGSDPDLMVSFSDDGGRTWGTEITAKAGKIGEYDTQVRLFGLGQFRQRVIRIAISDPIPANIHGAWANMEATPV